MKLDRATTLVIVASLACATVGAFLVIQAINLYQVVFSPDTNFCFLVHQVVCNSFKIAAQWDLNVIEYAVSGVCLFIAAFEIVLLGSHFDKRKHFEEILESENRKG